ncbi:MAG TPA: ThiF family adenylyltransferase, partial [Kofleriaceae bacterium]|nr:ThiF family adenylyltransferase [Kofleriaceae bacterium]
MHVVLVGAGGLGGPLALALAAAGAELTIYDDDVVDASNLHRQVQFTLGDLGQPKAEVLALSYEAYEAADSQAVV